MKPLQHEANPLHNSLGYKAGRLVVKVRQRAIAWDRKLVQIAANKGFPRWVAKLPLVAFIITIAGLFAVSLFLLASILLMFAVLGFLFVAMANGMAADDEINLELPSLEGYCDGPDGVGEYAGGIRIDKNYDDGYD